MDRGLSTVLDVGVACLLITTSVLVLVVVPPQPTPPPPADRAGRALLASTITVPSNDHAVQTSVADAIVDAVTNGGPVDDDLSAATRKAIRDVSRDISPRLAVTATHPDTSHEVTIGPRPPPGASVDATVFHVDGGTPSDDAVVITVRTWST